MVTLVLLGKVLVEAGALVAGPALLVGIYHWRAHRSCPDTSTCRRAWGRNQCLLVDYPPGIRQD